MTFRVEVVCVGEEGDEAHPERGGWIPAQQRELRHAAGVDHQHGEGAGEQGPEHTRGAPR